MALLELKNVESYYGNVQALKGISLHVNEGEIVTLLGANGAGKSTTLRSISGLVSVTSGDILFNGQSILKVPAEKIVSNGIAHVPEGRRIFPGLTVTENIMIGSSARGNVSRKQLEDEVEEMFENCGGRRQLHRPFHQMREQHGAHRNLLRELLLLVCSLENSLRERDIPHFQRKLNKIAHMSALESNSTVGSTLTDLETRILDFERNWWRFAGAKESAIKELFDLSAARYYQLLNDLIDRDDQK